MISATLPDPSQPIVLRAAHNEIRFYTWGDCACCLPKGATSATLLDAWVPGDDSLETLVEHTRRTRVLRTANFARLMLSEAHRHGRFDRGTDAMQVVR